MPSRALQPTAAYEIDAFIGIARVGKTTITSVREDGIIPLSLTTIATLGAELEHRVDASGPQTQQISDLAIGLSPPMGSTALKASVQVGARIQGTIRPEVEVFPSITAGASAVWKSPGWLGGQTLGGSVLIVGQPTESGVFQTGVDAGVSASGHLPGSMTLGWMLAGELRQTPGAGTDVRVPLGVYLLMGGGSLTGVEAGYVASQIGDTWAKGGFVGLRISMFRTRSQLRRMRKPSRRPNTPSK